MTPIPLPWRAAAALALLAPSLRAADSVDLRFSFAAKPAPGFVAVRPADAYNVDRTYGFDLGSQVKAVADGAGVTGDRGRPFFFSTRLGPGAYRVTVTLGDPAADTVATVKSESRRLMLEAVHVPRGQSRDFTFLVHIRDPRLEGGELVRLKPREKEPILYLQWDRNDPATRRSFVELDWDEKLTLEFSDRHPALQAIRIVPEPRPVTVFVIGDSTVTDQMMEPWGAWGQQLPRWFKPPVLIANYAESGETAESFIAELRWRKLLSEIRPGDYVLMQFGINDQRMPVEKFKACFHRYIQDTRDHGATPVLVSSQNLRRLGPDGKAVQTLRGFPAAMRDAAREDHAAFIDLNAMSGVLYQSLGPDRLPKAFVDGTHQNMYGAYELAKCVVMGILANHLGFADGNLADDWRTFDPANPDPMEDFRLPPDPQLDPARPGGSGVPRGVGPMAGAAPALDHPKGISIDLWPEGLAGRKEGGPAETVRDGRVYHVRTPTLFGFLPPAGQACGTAVVYCPGGGYVRLPAERDGGDIRQWFNERGVAVFVLTYRFGDDGPDAPLLDVLRAIRIVRSRAAEFGLRPDRIGVFGGSAGGHVAALASTLFDDPKGRTGAALDRVSARPDFMAALYPVITMEDPYAHKGSRRGLLGDHPTAAEIERYSLEKQVTGATPPAFLVSTLEDKTVPMENSVGYYLALRRAGVAAELHLFEKGPHGFGFTPGLGPTSEWPERLEDWMRFHGWLPPL